MISRPTEVESLVISLWGFALWVAWIWLVNVFIWNVSLTNLRAVISNKFHLIAHWISYPLEWRFTFSKFFKMWTFCEHRTKHFFRLFYSSNDDTRRVWLFRWIDNVKEIKMLWKVLCIENDLLGVCRTRFDEPIPCCIGEKWVKRPSHHERKAFSVHLFTLFIQYFVH